MELKCVTTLVVTCCLCRSNCTFMELKFEWHGGKLRTESSNCTFMELKLQIEAVVIDISTF